MAAQREIALPCLLTFAACIAFLASSLGTEFWIKSRPVDTANIGKNLTRHSDTVDKFRGQINFGLFQGTEVLNFGLETNQVKTLRVICISKEGVCMYSDKETEEGRLEDLKNNLLIKLSSNGEDFEEVKNPYLVSYGLWASCIAFIGLSIAAATIGAIFCVVNSVMTPVEFLTGIRGLYIWTGLGSLFSLCAMIVYAVVFHKCLKKNVLNKVHFEKGWSSDGRSSLGYSFWFLLATFIIFTLNTVLLTLMIFKPWVRQKPKSSEQSNPNGVIMLY